MMNVFKLIIGSLLLSAMLTVAGNAQPGKLVANELTLAQKEKDKPKERPVEREKEKKDERPPEKKDDKKKKPDEQS